MRYRGKDIEIVGEKQIFGRRTAWVRLVEDNSLQQVLWDDIDFEEEPPFFKVSETHYAATWLLHPKAPKVEMPKIVSERIKISLRNAGMEVK